MGNKKPDIKRCCKAKVCYNGFSAYSPNAEMLKFEEEDRKRRRK